MITEIINHNNHTSPHKGEIIMIKTKVGGIITTLSISTINPRWNNFEEETPEWMNDDDEGEA